MKKFIKEFKEFISKGNAFDMAVGIIIGAAFNAIVTSITNILLAICTWGVPGGISGLITVLPPINDSQRGMLIGESYVQSFSSFDIQDVAKDLALSNYTIEEVTNNPSLIESSRNTLIDNYNLHGSTYTYKMCSVIDWGAFLNAVISFVIISITLFIIIKVMAKMRKIREIEEAKIKEKIEKKMHHEEQNLEE